MLKMHLANLQYYPNRTMEPIERIYCLFRVCRGLGSDVLTDELGVLTGNATNAGKDYWHIMQNLRGWKLCSLWPTKGNLEGRFSDLCNNLMSWEVVGAEREGNLDTLLEYGADDDVLTHVTVDSSLTVDKGEASDLMASLHPTHISWIALHEIAVLFEASETTQSTRIYSSRCSFLRRMKRREFCQDGHEAFIAVAQALLVKIDFHVERRIARCQ